MLEIYNENLYDLLGKSSAREEKLEVKLLAKGEDVHVPKLTSMDVKSGDQVRSLLSRHLSCWTHSCIVFIKNVGTSTSVDIQETKYI